MSYQETQKDRDFNRVTELMGDYLESQKRKIHRVTAVGCLVIECRAGAHIMGHIGNANLPSVDDAAANRLIASLDNPLAFGHPIKYLRLIETHISWIILTGDYAYKIKKPVDYGFLDFSTLEKRRFYCAEELRLNRRFAPWFCLDTSFA